MLACLTDGTLKLVSCGYLRSEVATPLPRRQELPEQAFLSPDAAVEAYKAGRVFVLSHGCTSGLGLGQAAGRGGEGDRGTRMRAGCSRLAIASCPSTHRADCQAPRPTRTSSGDAPEVPVHRLIRWLRDVHGLALAASEGWRRPSDGARGVHLQGRPRGVCQPGLQKGLVGWGGKGKDEVR